MSGLPPQGATSAASTAASSASTAPPAASSSSSVSAASNGGSIATATSVGASLTTQIGGVPVEFGQAVNMTTKKALQRQLNSMLGWNEFDRAPMSLPQAFVRANQPQIGDHPYFVSERSVGIRYLVVLVQGRCYLVMQNYEIREVVLFSPVRPDRLQPGMDRNTFVPHQWTVLDGLLVCDKEGSKSTLTMIVNDILALNGTLVMNSKLQDRLKLVQNDVIAPRKTVPMPKGQPPDQFQLVQQYMYPVNRVSHVIRSIIPRVSQTRQNIGLVFTPVMLPYTPGYAKGLFAWSPTTVLTVDFQLGVEWRGRPPKPGFKLMLHDKRTQHFHDWITFAPEEFEHFRSDKKASSRIVECVYDPEWLTFIPSHDKTSWEVGSPEFIGTERGQGWRKGGWRYVRSRADRGMPIERSFLMLYEKAISEDVRLEEVEQLFPEDPSKKPAIVQPKPRETPAPAQEEFPQGKKKRGVGPGTGVCYDFQNKGVCQRGRFCHFSHCACNSTCSCTPAKNTYGQRPAYRRTDFDAPPSPDIPPSSDPSLQPDKAQLRSTDPYDNPSKSDLHHYDEEEAGELADAAGNLNVASVYAPLENFDKETLAAKRAQLSALNNRRIWASLGLEDKAPRKRPCGLVVSKTGELTIRKLSTEPNSSKFAIDAHNRSIQEVQDLSELPKLCSLDVSFNRLTTLRNIHTAKELRELKAYNNRITTTKGLRGISALEGLLLNENQIEVLTDDFLALVKLKTLSLGGNRLSRVAYLGSCRLLVHLDLSRNRLEGAVTQGLESLSSLEILNMNGNSLTSVGNLTHLTKLEELDLSDNALTTVEGLLPPNLTVLRLNGNRLTTLQHLSSAPSLNELYVHDNQLTAIDTIATQCPQLESLDLRNNRIRSGSVVIAAMGPLKDVLRDLWLSGNPCCLSDSYLLDLYTAFPELKTLESFSDSQLVTQMTALKSGSVTQEALLMSALRPSTPSHRPGTASTNRPGSASRPITPTSRGSRPGTPDRPGGGSAPVFHQHSARTGTILKLMSPAELEKAQADVAERLENVKALLKRVGNSDGNKSRSNTRSTENPKPPIRRRASSESVNKGAENNGAKASLGKVADMIPSKTEPVAVRTDEITKKAMADAGTDPFESILSNQADESWSIPTPRTSMETQTHQAALPPAPTVIPAAPSPARSISTSTVTKEDTQVDGEAIAREMKLTLLRYASEKQLEEPQDEENEHPNDNNVMESPRIVSSKTAEQRRPPNPRSRQGYRSFRIPTPRTQAQSEDGRMPTAV
ncbi:hypothetical protein Poli38472_005565 [Pythium oligandrum]|uniref:C3H1-type domain-containing protein n=1 Tax=Pythium oligandrum TaxID=41045 RepID=A0A8K1CGI8_PYTOL|nr:hypothetical protein Poli38472_005565 [Pythium oligandrum]|eukprot:TMW62947.1 hypothetical protein Poli38472_005565 [Pythium oligandrum]